MSDDKSLTPAQADRFHEDVARLDSIRNSLTGLGGPNDKGAVGEVDMTRRYMTESEHEVLYEFNGFARRLVDIVPNDATRKGWIVPVQGEPDVNLVAEFDKQMRTVTKYADANRWARLYGGAAILIVTDDPADEWDQPINEKNIKRIDNMVVYDRTEIDALDVESNIRNPSYRDVAYWQISPSEGTVSDGEQEEGSDEITGALSKVHHSRVIYFPGAPLSPSRRQANDWMDMSIIDYMWDQIRNLTQTGQAGATIAQELKKTVLKVQGYGSSQVSDQKGLVQTKLETIALSMAILGITVIGDGDDMMEHSLSATGYKDLSEMQWQSLMAVAGIPASRFRGDGPGNLQNDDKAGARSWDAVIQAVQEYIYLPRLEYMYRLLLLSKEGPTRGKLPEDWSVEFNPLDVPTEDETAATNKTTAETDAIYTQIAGIGSEFSTKVIELRSGPEGIYPNIDPENDTEPDETEPEDDDRGDSRSNRGRFKTGRADGKMLTIPAPARRNASKVLGWIKEHGDEVKGLSGIGLARAEQLASARRVSLEDVVDILDWHDNHPGGAKVSAKHKSSPWMDRQHVRFLGWGGPTMRTEAARIVLRNTGEDEVTEEAIAQATAVLDEKGG